MEKFNHKQYRDNLAQDLKDIHKTDPEMAQKVLGEEKETTRYKYSKDLQDKERVYKLENKTKNDIEEKIHNLFSPYLGARYGSYNEFTRKNINEIKNLLIEKQVPLDTENSILKMHTEIPNEYKECITSCTLEKGSGENEKGIVMNVRVNRYSTPRKIIFDHEGVYFEIVPIGASNMESYIARVPDVEMFAGPESSTVAFEDGCGIYLKAKDNLSAVEKILESHKDVTLNNQNDTGEIISEIIKKIIAPLGESHFNDPRRTLYSFFEFYLI